MSVILLILKIIGMILLALLGLLLFLIVLVMFVPVRYRITGEVEDAVSVSVSVTWLLHLITWRGAYEQGEFDSGIRIFGICIKGKKKKAPEDVKKTVEQSLETAPEDVKKTVEQPLETAPEDVKKTVEQPLAVTAENEEEVPGQPDDNRGEPADGQSGSENRKRTGWIQSVQSLFDNIKRRILAIKNGIPQIKEKISDIKSILIDENNKIVVAGIFGELKYLLEHFKFRKIDTQLRFSLGDPATTGQVLGGLCMMPFLYRYQFHLYPDFEADEPYLRGTFDISGRVRGVHGLVSFIRLIWKKEVRTLIKKLINR